MLRMNFNRDARSIIPNADDVLFHVKINLDQVHLLVSLIVVRSIDKDFIKDLVKSWHKADLLVL
jgi:hypothetical protein